ncbi:hypothetical protein P171DRAFT_205008 [Karstenula rhodostoma CBS 690.94]|uniref:FAD-binding FR-type domain-containing protein n=1 Tax=Karstenula rhodostoma CBS 690.94 TaxID=1392251 RepID=A0A9P4UHZ7_9PLEO|nr:hypothetical protein P171DRAFT_205008 [Karstenula rhodostoma CBS 690.94]
MVFGYRIYSLSDEEKHAMRVLLDWYPLVAQWSVLVVFVAFQLGFLLSWLANKGLEYERPRSPSFNKRLEGQWTWLRKSTQAWNRLAWWTKKDVISGWGTRAEWIGGGLWTVWLLYLSIAPAGNNYIHLTKNFGAIGASQLPLHYLLAMRTPYSPLQLLTRLSHEQLKSSHQILGRIVFLLFSLHAACYINLFIQMNALAKRIQMADVIFGLISIALFAAISTTALSQIRRWNYRVFYISHVAIANILVVPLYLHVHHIRPYVWEVVIVNALHLLSRFIAHKTYTGTISILPGTHLIQIRIPLTSLSSTLSWRPGQHVYLSLPTGKHYSASLSDQFTLRNKTNPFTVASIPVKDKELLLVAKTLKGNTKKLSELATSLAKEGGEAPSIPLALEGPYGASSHLPDLSSYDKILLVAGGVGATFVLPIYRSIVEFRDSDHAGQPQVRFIWAVQRLADTQWAFSSSSSFEATAANGDGDADSNAGDEGVADGLAPTTPAAVEVFVTRGAASALPLGGNGEEIELAEDDQLLSLEEEMQKPRPGVVLKTGRPKIPAIVDEVFSRGTRVAVVTCGPKRLTSKLRESVEQWVRQGVEVYWHEETFGW